MANLIQRFLNTHYRCETQGQIVEPFHTSVFSPVNPRESRRVFCEDYMILTETTYV